MALSSLFARSFSSCSILALLIVLTACQPSGVESTPPVGSADRAVINSQLPDRPYSDAVRVGDSYYFSGRIAVTPESRGLADGRIEMETRGVMEGFRELLDELGLDFSHMVKGTVFLTDMGDYDGMNRVYGEYFPTDPPARETVAVRELPGGAIVEISFIAVRD